MCSSDFVCLCLIFQALYLSSLKNNVFFFFSSLGRRRRSAYRIIVFCPHWVCSRWRFRCFFSSFLDVFQSIPPFISFEVKFEEKWSTPIWISRRTEFERNTLSMLRNFVKGRDLLATFQAGSSGVSPGNRKMILSASNRALSKALQVNSLCQWIRAASSLTVDQATRNGAGASAFWFVIL